MKIARPDFHPIISNILIKVIKIIHPSSNGVNMMLYFTEVEKGKASEFSSCLHYPLVISKNIKCEDFILYPRVMCEPISINIFIAEEKIFLFSSGIHILSCAVFFHIVGTYFSHFLLRTLDVLRNGLVVNSVKYCKHLDVFLFRVRRYLFPSSSVLFLL